MKIAQFTVTNDSPFFLMAGPCVIESESLVMRIAEQMKEITQRLNIPYIFKASYDKANRSSVDSYRGPGIEKGMEILSDLKGKHNVPIISDVHNEREAEIAKDVLDVIQIPAFLCRQTDLVEQIAKTGLPVNIKKAQFMSPSDIENVITKFKSYGNERLLLCERGTSFGYNNLVVDMIGLASLKTYNHPVIFDVTHSLQKPGGLGSKTAGRRENVLDLAKSGMSLGLAGLFLETHPDPDTAKCDGPCALPLTHLKEFLSQIKSLDDLVKSFNALKLD